MSQTVNKRQCMWLHSLFESNLRNYSCWLHRAGKNWNQVVQTSCFVSPPPACTSLRCQASLPQKKTWKLLPPSLREAFLWFSSCIRARCLWHGGKISRNVAVVILVSGFYFLCVCVYSEGSSASLMFGGKLPFGEKLWRWRLCGCRLCVHISCMATLHHDFPYLLRVSLWFEVDGITFLR